VTDLPHRSEGGAALTELILLVFRLNGRLLEAAEQLARAGGLTAARWQVLGDVLDEPRPVSEIARRMGLTRQSVQRLANVLVEEGLATWEPNPRHRRAKLLKPSESAYAAIHDIAIRQHPWSSAIGDAIGAHTLKSASATLEQVLEAIREHHGRGGHEARSADVTGAEPQPSLGTGPRSTGLPQKS
jgi:DNA-binding MarR family transcriptional regulator